jgi:hypothetical protein
MESVRFDYKYEGGKKVFSAYNRYLDIVEHLRRGGDLTLDMEQKRETISFYLKGRVESFHEGLSQIFEAGLFPEKIEIDYCQGIFNQLARITPRFRTSTSLGHFLAKDMLEKKGVKFKEWRWYDFKSYYVGCAGCSIGKT